MIKKEYRLICVAIIIGALGVGAYLFLNSRESTEPTAPEARTSSSGSTTQDPEMTSPEDSTPLEDSPSVSTEDTGPRDPTPEELALHTDPEIESQKKLVNDFKKLTQMSVNFPPDFEFKNLDIDGEIAGIEGVTSMGDRKMVVLAARTTPSPQAIASYLNDQKGNIPSLADHTFKISGKLRNIEVPPGKGISKITLIPGGENKGTKIVAAHIHRTDGKGSYVFIIRASQSYYENYEGEVESMLESFSTK